MTGEAQGLGEHSTLEAVLDVAYNARPDPVQSKDITVFGSGEQRRCFGDVFAVVESLMRLVECEDPCGN